MPGRRGLHTDVTSPFWIIWLHRYVTACCVSSTPPLLYSPPKSIIASTFLSLVCSPEPLHVCVYLCLTTCVHLLYLCVCVCGRRWRKTSKQVREGWRETDPPPAFSSPPGQEDWRARSDFWSRPFPAAYENKWSKLPCVITRKCLHFATSHFSPCNSYMFF